ncbi:molybdopterin-dependent oxidoreductase [Arabiibacter massiliensis]|uniref:molybdopterin-dependent oxidoreductase n=1 Tax=Arabiibacter massiliensis TaxID=1870985 RepID=UPI0009BB6885|nr:molybdopterin-dependent oxidoreductase [Arabiibacter massiliensis]
MKGTKEEPAATRSKTAKAFLATAAAVLVVGAFLLAGCQPQAAGQDGGGTEDKAKSSAPAITTTTGANFQNVDTGDLPDIYQNQLQNTGNRGCNSCHEDLIDVLQTTNPKHIIDYAGYDKAMTYADCQPCHDFRWGRAGIYFGDSIHASHYANPMFTDEQNGNCWSCHATLNGEDKEVTWELWDEVKYDSLYAGYDDPTDVNTLYWVQSRGIADSGYISGVNVAASPNVDVRFSQPVTDEKDCMEINNWQSIDINGTQWHLEDYDYSDWKLEIKGVNNPRSFTLDELKGMPQTEYTVTQCCETTGLGCTTVMNIPVKGVLMADIIEACGGLAADEATVQMFPVSADTWTGEGYDGMSISSILAADGMVALEFYGHELNDNQGAPACVVTPGTPGAAWVKHVASLDFRAMDDPEKVFNPYDRNKFIEAIYPVNSAFFQEDGTTFKKGEPVQLTGFSFSWASSMGAINKVSFSLDYGDTWVDFAPPADLDPTQWTYWDFSWTPEEAGTYVVKVLAESEDGSVQTAPANIIVTVEK